MVNVRIPPGANCLLATKLQTDSTGYTLESVIHIGYDSLRITTIHPKDSLLWKDFSNRGFLLWIIYYVHSIPWLSFIFVIQYGQAHQTLSAGKGRRGSMCIVIDIFIVKAIMAPG